MRFAAYVLAILSLAVGHAQGAASPAGPTGQRMIVDARGPVALVEVIRAVTPASGEGGGGAEGLLDLALPQPGALVSVEVRDGSRWRSVDPVDRTSTAADVYRAESAARGVTPTTEPFDEGTTHRIRLLRSAGGGAAPFLVRYRFALLPEARGGRLRLRFPAAADLVPIPAEVAVQLRDATNIDIAGVPAVLGASGTANGRASTRGAWEISWTPREVPPSAPPLQARLAMAPLSATQTAVAFLVRHRGAPPTDLPGSVLFLVDRSRSVGLAGLSAERDLVRALLEALPPSTRFDALFFERGTKRLFPGSRPATREAIDAFEAEMVPDRLQNGTDLPGALRTAGALLNREAALFGPRVLLVLVTDGALADDVDGSALDRALGVVPGLDVDLAALTIRPRDDEPVGARARDALRDLAAARGGVARALSASDIADAVPAALADLRRGGDLGEIRLVAGGITRRLSESLPPEGLLAGVVAFQGRPPRGLRVEASTRGRKLSVAPPPTHLQPAWLRPWVGQSPPPLTRRSSKGPWRLLSAPAIVAMVQPAPAAPSREAAPEVKGTMGRLVIRNVLSLAYLPRARACYLNRTAATPALRDLTGKVRLAIDLVRGEVARATIASSTLNNADVERCLRESAFQIVVPRATRSDAPVTAVLNMIFRPSTPPKKTDIDLGAIGDQIDLVIEEMHKRDASAPPAPPAH